MRGLTVAVASKVPEAGEDGLNRDVPADDDDLDALEREKVWPRQGWVRLLEACFGCVLGALGAELTSDLVELLEDGLLVEACRKRHGWAGM